MDAAVPAPQPVFGGPVLTPDLVAQMVWFEKVTGPIWVRGIAKDVRPWEKGSLRRCYGKLQYGDASLPFRLNSGVDPAEGKEVILAGVLTVTKSFGVELQGEAVGGWHTQAIEKHISLPSRTQPVVLLSKFVAENPLEALGFLTTKTGWEDICGAAQLPEVRRCPQQQVSFVDESDFLGGIDELVKQGVTGIVIARGGGEKLGAIADSVAVARKLIEVGLPFYTALGHATDHGLLDKYADQSFLTPSDLAHRLCAHVEAERAAGDDREAAEDAERERNEAFAIVSAQAKTIQEIGQLRKELDATNEQLKAEVSKQAGARRNWSIAFAIAAAIALIAIIALLRR